MSNEVDIPGGTFFQTEVSGLVTPIDGVLIGSDSDFLLVKVTSKIFFGEIEEKLCEGSEVMVRYRLNSSAFRFDSILAGCISHPIVLFFVKKPLVVKNDSFRSIQRINCSIAGKIEIDERDFKGQILNVSKKGCLFSLTDLVTEEKSTFLSLFNEGKGVELTFLLKSHSDRIVMAGKMKRLNSTSGNLSFGIEFESMPSDLMEKIVINI